MLSLTQTHLLQRLLEHKVQSRSCSQKMCESVALQDLNRFLWCSICRHLCSFNKPSTHECSVYQYLHWITWYCKECHRGRHLFHFLHCSNAMKEGGWSGPRREEEITTSFPTSYLSLFHDSTDRGSGKCVSVHAEISPNTNCRHYFWSCV